MKDVPLQSRGARSKPYVYVPYWQNAKTLEARLCVHVSGDPAAMLPRLTREVNRVDPDVPIAETITLPVQLDGMFRPLRMAVILFGMCAGTGLPMAGVLLIRNLVFGSATGDWVVYTCALSLVICTGLFACWFPARRAGRIAPLDALRQD